MVLSKDRKSELMRKGALDHGEAAEFLDIGKQQLYNRYTEAKKRGDPSWAPPREKDHRGQNVYSADALAAWKRTRSTVHKGH